MSTVVLIVVTFGLAAYAVNAFLGWFGRWSRRQTVSDRAQVELASERSRIAARAAADQLSVSSFDFVEWDAWLRMDSNR